MYGESGEFFWRQDLETRRRDRIVSEDIQRILREISAYAQIASQTQNGDESRCGRKIRGLSQSQYQGVLDEAVNKIMREIQIILEDYEDVENILALIKIGLRHFLFIELCNEEENSSASENTDHILAITGAVLEKVTVRMLHL